MKLNYDLRASVVANRSSYAEPQRRSSTSADCFALPKEAPLFKERHAAMARNEKQGALRPNGRAVPAEC
jgi:hypothetical protein